MMLYCSMRVNCGFWHGFPPSPIFCQLQTDSPRFRKPERYCLSEAAASAVDAGASQAGFLSIDSALYPKVGGRESPPKLDPLVKLTALCCLCLCVRMLIAR